MNSVLWWNDLSALVDSFGASCNEANSQLSHLYANASCKDVLRVFTAEYGSESTSELRSSGEMEIKSNDRNAFASLCASQTVGSEMSLEMPPDMHSDLIIGQLEVGIGS